MYCTIYYIVYRLFPDNLLLTHKSSQLSLKELSLPQENFQDLDGNFFLHASL